MNSFTQTKAVLDPDTGQPIRDEEGKIIYEPATVTWEEVGLKIIDDHSFQVTFFEPVTQSTAIDLVTLT